MILLFSVLSVKFKDGVVNDVVEIKSRIGQSKKETFLPPIVVESQQDF